METEYFKLNSPHIAAQIYYLRFDEGGRQSPVNSGYRGQFHINGSDWDAAQEFIDRQFCNPGETVKAYIKFASVHEIVPMAVGTPFQIREGNRIVGKGFITVIIDNSILQSSSRRELYKLIDEVTWTDWDPIGVNNIKEARDEYYSYLPTLLSIILKGANKETLAGYLYKIEMEHMGLSGNYETCLKVADKLLGHNK